jgi:hypothetical protein
MEQHHPTILPKDMIRAGTGEMQCLSEAIKLLQEKGYNRSLVPAYDHFTCVNRTIKLYPEEIFFDEVMRFENTSDPDDQSILYAISSLADDIKGIYVESYGLYHDDLSPEMIKRMQYCHALRQNSPHPSGTGLAL